MDSFVVSAVAKPAVSALVGGLFSRCGSALKQASSIIVDAMGNRFNDYISRQYDRYSHISTIVFEVRRPLEELYVPLTVVQKTIDGSGHGEPDVFKMNRYNLDFLHNRKRVLLTDDAGMGKSTLVKFMMMEAINNKITIPILIELRNISSEKSMLDVVVQEVNKYGGVDAEISKEFMLKCLNSGEFTFFFDGYDEVDQKIKENVTIGLKRFIEAYPDNRYMITSRPEYTLNSFPSFDIFSIKDLEVSEAYNLIKKYDNNGERSMRLIERLSDNSISEVRDFLKNPLLTTLLYRAYEHKNHIPIKKHFFYRQVYDALYEWHDLTKDGYCSRQKKSGLDIDGFHKILRAIGFCSLIDGKIGGGKDDVIKWIKTAQQYFPELKFAESGFLDDMVRAVPIFRKDGEDYYWAHKSLAEYFAACFLSMDLKDDQARVCDYFYSDGLNKYKNFLDLLYDIDINIFKKFFTKRIVDAYTNNLNKLLEDFPDISRIYLEDRAAVSLGVVGINITDGRDDGNSAFVRDAIIKLGGSVPVSVFDNHGCKVLLMRESIYSIIDVLISKKDYIVVLKHFYPDFSGKSKIVGIPKRRNVYIDANPTALWNRAPNFSSTTNIIMKALPGILNKSKVDIVLDEIDKIGRTYSITSGLLGRG